MGKIKNSILLGIVFYLTSCADNSIVKQHVVDFSGREIWPKDSVISVDFKPETNIDYDLAFLIRNSNAYPFSNIFLIASIENTKHKVVDTLEYEMANEKGEWLGTGFGDIKESKLIYKKNYRFPDSLPYTITLQQAVRRTGNVKGEEKLKGIVSVGIVIEKSKTK